MRRDTLDRYATISLSVDNIGGEFFHPMCRASGIATSYSSFPSEGKTNHRLGASIGFIPMWYKPFLTSTFSTYTGPKAGSVMTISLIRRSSDHPYCMADREAIGKDYLFKLE